MKYFKNVKRRGSGYVAKDRRGQEYIFSSKKELEDTDEELSQVSKKTTPAGLILILILAVIIYAVYMIFIKK